MSGTNTLNNIMAMHTAKQQVQQQQIQQPQPFQVVKIPETIKCRRTLK